MYKKIVLTFVSIVSISVGCFLGLCIIVDSIGTHNTPIIKGINNYKIKQGGFQNVYKPYGLIDEKIKVIFIGTSRIYVGMAPSLDGYADNEVYNLGISALSLVDTEKYLDFVYEIHKPEKIFLGLDFFSFRKDRYNFIQQSFSDERLSRLALLNKNIITKKLIYLMSISEDLAVKDTILPTIKNSIKKSEIVKIYPRGWDKERGTSESVNEKEYYNSLSFYNNVLYNNYVGTQEAVKVVSRIISKAKFHNVEIFVFFNPISIDMYSLIQLKNLGKELSNIKKIITKLAGITYDFNFVNSYTCDRRKYFYDSSHWNAKFGEIIKEDIISGIDTQRMLILTPNNIEKKLVMEREGYDKWADENKSYVDFFRIVANNSKRLKYGEMKAFIGF